MNSGDTAWMLMSTALVMIMLPGLALFYGELVRSKNVLSTALVIGLFAGGLCYSATLLRVRSRADDALDVFAVHGVGGMFGAIATGIFASSTVQAAYSGLLQGNPQQLVNQLIAVGATVAYAVVGTVAIVKVVDVLLGIRVKPAAEEMGLDLSTHGEAAYTA
jgi:Ammonia permease